MNKRAFIILLVAVILIPALSFAGPPPLPPKNPLPGFIGSACATGQVPVKQADGTYGCATTTGTGDMSAAAWDGDTNGAIDVTAGGTNKTAWTQYAIPYLTSSVIFGQIAIGTAHQTLQVNGTADGYAYVTLGGTCTNQYVSAISNAGVPTCSDFPALGIATGLSGQYIDWNASTGGTSIANKPTLGTMAAETATNYVLKSLYDANTILYATTDNTPAALTVGEATLVGRATGGNIAAIGLGTGLTITGGNLTPGALTGSMMTNNTVTATQLAATLTFADGDFLDLTGITQTGGVDEGLAIPTWANVSPATDTKNFLASAGTALKLWDTVNKGWITIAPTGAPTDATYLTLSNDATLSAERVLTAGTGIAFTDAGANSALTLALDPTKLTGNRAWSDGSGATVAWTWNVSTGTDPSITFGNGSITLNNTTTFPTPFTLGATSVTSTGAQLNYLAAATGTTGTASTNLVYSTSPTLVTPVLGAATATSINKMAITAPATSSTLAVADGKVFTASNTLTLAGTDSTTMTFPTTSKTIAASDASNLAVGSDARGDILVRGASVYGRLGKGASGALLTGDGTDTKWSAYTHDAPGAVNAVPCSDGTNWIRCTAPTISAANMTSIAAANLLIASQAQGDLLYASGASTWARLGQSTQYKFLITNGAAANPSWSAYTMPASIATGDLPYGSGTNAVSALSIGGSGDASGGTPLIRNATVPAWSSVYTPSTIAAGSVFGANSANTLSAITSTSGTKFLQNNAGTISWQTGVGTIGGATGATDKAILRANGTGGATLQNSLCSIDDSGVLSCPSFSAAASDGSNKLTLSNNTVAMTPTASAHEMYVESNVWKINQNGTEYSIPLSATANQATIGAVTSGGILYGSASNAISSTGVLTNHGVILAQGAATAPTVALDVSHPTYAMFANTAADPTFRAIAVADLPVVTASKGGTGVANNDANTITFSGGNYSLGLTLSGNTSLTFPTSGTVLVGTTGATANAIAIRGANSGTVAASPTTIDPTTGVITIPKTSGQESYVRLYQANSTDTYGIEWGGPTGRTAASNLRLNLPDADPAGQCMQCATPAGGKSACIWVPCGNGGSTSMGSCGSSPSLATNSKDFKGVITVGSGILTSCVMNFGGTYTNALACQVQASDGTVLTAVTPTNTTLTVTATSLTSKTLTYFCKSMDN